MSMLPVRRNSRETLDDPLVQLQNDVNAVFDRVFRGFGFFDPLAVRSGFSPAIDIDEDEHNYYLQMDLPGVDRGDVIAEVDNGVLTIRGEKRVEREQGGRRSHSTERYYGRFYRQIALPQDADVEQLNAQLKRGVLTITIPKGDSSNRRQIEIQGE
ncbi:MAG: heat-shock protein Hsp20 [Sulfobacillus acidophilus]|uniref:Heat-shock protein Hsp20 n=1 Tax=Sulfobacillus acidophilus TaxID=53633 RepID=A0A2T2WHX8_9FIRM|nr:MAG: heat-shock protein Hsp20 [Sulfobacillus acidophilus]